MALRIGVVKGEILIRINGSDELTKVGEIEIPIEVETTTNRDKTTSRLKGGDAVTVVQHTNPPQGHADPRAVVEAARRARSAAERAGRGISPN